MALRPPQNAVFIVSGTFRCCGGQVLRRYLVQNRDDYVKYNKIVGLITKLTARLKVKDTAYAAKRPVGCLQSGHVVRSFRVMCFAEAP